MTTTALGWFDPILNASAWFGDDAVPAKWFGGDTDTSTVYVSPTLVSRWTFDTVDVSGTTVTDIVGGKNFTANTAPTLLAGVVGDTAINSLSSVHVGTTDTVLTAANDAAHSPTSITVAFRGKITKPPSSHYAGGFFNNDANGGFSNILSQALGIGWNLTVRQDSTHTSNATWNNNIPDGSAFHHYAFTWDENASLIPGHNAEFWVDGVLQTASTRSTQGAGKPMGASAAALVLGKTPATEYSWDGLIDDLRVYNGAMNATDILSLSLEQYLYPATLSDGDTFFAATLASTYALTPSLFSDGDTFFASTVTPGAVNLAPSLFSDGDTFFASTVTPGAVDLAPSLFSDGDTFFAATVASTYALAPSLFSDGDTFFAATVTPGAVDLGPSLFSDGDTFFAATVTPGAVDLGPSLFSDGDTFYSATVTPGAVDLAPSLFSDGDTFYSATVTPGAVDLAPALFSDGDTFYSATVTPGAVDLAPSLFSDGEAFYSATVTPGAVDLAPSLFSDGEAFYSATVTPGAVDLAPPLFSDGDTFYSAIVAAGAVSLAPSLFSDADVFHSATVAPGAVDLAPALFSDGETFFDATVTPGAVDLAPALFSDGETFFAPVVAATQNKRIASAIALVKSAQSAADTLGSAATVRVHVDHASSAGAEPAESTVSLTSTPERSDAEVN